MNIFIDCGTNFKQGLLHIFNENKFDIEKVYSFEANKIIYEQLDKNDGFNYFNLAVSNKNGFSNFYLEKDIRNNQYVGGGSRLNNPKDGLLDLFKNENIYYEISNGNKTNRLDEFVEDMYLKSITPTIRLVDFINFLNVPDKSVYLKLDVEGAEYMILQDMKESDTFKKIKKIYIEFHEWNRDQTYDSDIIWIKFFKDNSIEYSKWD